MASRPFADGHFPACRATAFLSALAAGCLGTLIVGFVGAARRSETAGKSARQEFSAAAPASGNATIQRTTTEALAPASDGTPLPETDPTGDTALACGAFENPDGRPVAAPTAAARAPLPGLISAPTLLPGNRRWQMLCKNPRRAAGGADWSPDSRWLAIATGRAVRIYDTNGVPEFQKVLVGHSDFVRSVRFSPNGKLIATASLDGTVRIWDLEGREVFVYCDHEDAVHDVAWHPDGNRLASASRDGTVRIWSREGKTVAKLGDHKASVNAVAWSPDGKLLASGCQNKVIRYWTPDGGRGEVVEGHFGPVTSLAWNVDSTLLLSCDHGIEAKDERAQDIAHIKIWDWLGNAVNSVIVNHPLSHVCWNPDGTIALAGGARSILLWPVGTRQPVVQLPALGVNVPVAWRPSGDLIAAGPQLHGADGRPLNSIALRNIELDSVGQNPDGTLLGVGRADRIFYLYDSDGKRRHISPPLPGGNWIQTIRWSPDGKTFIPGQRYARSLQRYDASGNKSGEPIPLPADTRSVDWSRDGRFVATGGDAMIVLLVDLETSQVTQLGKQAHGITQVRFTPDQQQICSAGFDGCVRFWSRDGTPGNVLEAEDAPIRGLAWASDGKLLATGHEDNSVRFWNRAGECEHVVVGHGGYVETLDFNPAGTLLASGSWDNTVRIWKRDGSPVSVLRGHEGAVFGVQWTPDGRRVFSCGDDGAIRLWDTASGETVWQSLLGEAGGYVTLDSHGRVKHGDEKILESDFVFFAEDGQGRLARTDWPHIRAVIQSVEKAAGQE